MDEEWQPDAIVRVKLEALRKDFFDYIEKNIDKIDENVPVFYGHVVCTLEQSIPDINETHHDKFIDSITVKVLDTSGRSGDIAFVGKSVRSCAEK